MGDGNSGVTLAGNTPTANVFTAANQIPGNSYDAAGNLLTVNGNAASYDAENRLASVSEAPAYGGGSETLLYDGLGQRVEKTIAGGATTVFVYDAFGKLAAEYATSPVQAPCTTCYLVWDQLGSTRLVTDQDGNIVARHDYLPYGEEIATGTAGRNWQWGLFDNVNRKFTGQVRDSETGQDFFNARYFTGTLGRFNSPDPANAGADLANPQSWNGYSYVGNNPLNAVDPSGMATINPGGTNPIDDGGNGVGTGNNGCSPGVTFCTLAYGIGDQNPQPVQTPASDWLLFQGGLFGNTAGGGSGSGGGNKSKPPGNRPTKTGTNPRPGPSICAGYGTVCFPTTAPTPQPVNWKKFMMYMSCLAGAPPELMAVRSGSPQDSTDSVPQTQGPTTYWGQTPGKQRPMLPLA